MPAITSPFNALRLSGRLMVIQNACPRFSRITLLFSLIGTTCFPVRTINLRREDSRRQVANSCVRVAGVRRRTRGGYFNDRSMNWRGTPDLAGSVLLQESRAQPENAPRRRSSIAVANMGTLYTSRNISDVAIGQRDP